jgi:hypothetical protein
MNYEVDRYDYYYYLYYYYHTIVLIRIPRILIRLIFE